jgi:glycosyltransferase involved in cell wall biosynthesis
MNVTLFTGFDAKLNPYILLFKKALEHQGYGVRFEKKFNINWFLSKFNSCDCIHLHWLNLSNNILKKNKSRSRYIRFFFNRITIAIFDFIRLFEFVLTFLIAKLARKIIVFTVHDLYDFKKKSIRWRLHLKIARSIVFRFSNSIHVHNEHTRNLIEDQYRRKKHIYVIPHGNFIGYYPNKVSKSEARQLLNLSDDSIVYLFLGLLRPYKGLEDLIQAFNKLDLPEARLLIAGRVFEVENYESKLKALSRNDNRIHLVPKFIPDNDIQIYLNACDFFVLPYKDITTSGTAALSISFGRPVIAPSITSFPEVVIPQAGILYDPAKPAALLNALNQARKKHFSETQILNYAHRFNWDDIGSKLAQLYHT